jgi:uncharacterized protein
MTLCTLSGAGLGLRRAFIGSLLEQDTIDADFLEIAPENWINLGGRFSHQLDQIAARRPLICHGLSLSLGSPSPLDEEFIREVRDFIKSYNISIYSEHLSYCSDHGHLYDLMPIPFTEQAAHYVAARIERVQHILQQRIAIENVSYYAAPGQEMSELEFINLVLSRADCNVLLDVNNVYVNSVNHRYDPIAFLQALPTDRIAYLHVAGHYREAEDLIVDTHGADVIDPVWQLLETTYRIHGIKPTLLERDFNFPPLDKLFGELAHIRGLQENAASFQF